MARLPRPQIADVHNTSSSAATITPLASFILRFTNAYAKDCIDTSHRQNHYR